MHALAAPQNLDAEEHVIGAMLLSRSAIDAVLFALEPDGGEKFYRASHGVLYDTARALRLANEPVDPITVATRLERQNQLEDAGGRARVNELAAIVPSTSNAAHYAQIVHEEWARRHVQAALRESHRELLQGGSAEETLAGAERRLLGVRSTVEAGRETRSYSAEDLAHNFETLVASPPPADAGIPAPFAFIPRMFGGRLYVLAGYTADGKTTLALQFLKSMSGGEGPIGFVSLEMSAADLTDRFVSSFGIPYRQVMNKQFSPPYDLRVRDALGQMRGLPFEIVDDANADAAAIARYTMVGGYKAVIVDHLHRFDWQERRQLEREVRGLTNLARTQNIPVLLLAQLRRAHGDKPFPRPSLASLRETAVIEQEAWMVSFIYRIRDPKTGEPTSEAEWIVAKNRGGPLGITSLHFDGAQVRYLPLEPEH